MEQLKDHISTLTIPNTVRIMALVDTFELLSKRKEIHLL